METSSDRRLVFVTAAAFVSLIWLGMVLGISFLETPMKFRAPTITVAVALDVGRTVFRYFFPVQLVLLLLTAIAIFFSRAPRLHWLIVGIVAVALFVQVVWLLPVLDARVSIVQAGLPLPKTPVHNIYALCEVLKVVGLIWLGIGNMNRLRRA